MPLLVEAFVRYDDECEDCCDYSSSGDRGVENGHACGLVGSYQCVLLRGLSEASNLELIAARHAEIQLFKLSLLLKKGVQEADIIFLNLISAFVRIAQTYRVLPAALSPIF